MAQMTGAAFQSRAVSPKRPRTPGATPPSRPVYRAGGVPVSVRKTMVDPTLLDGAVENLEEKPTAQIHGSRSSHADGVADSTLARHPWTSMTNVKRWDLALASPVHEIPQEGSVHLLHQHGLAPQSAPP